MCFTQGGVALSVDAPAGHLHFSTNTDMLLAYHSHGTFFGMFAIAHALVTGNPIVAAGRPPRSEY